MSTNLAQVSFDESLPIVVDFINAVAGGSSAEADTLDIRDNGVVVRWHESTTQHVYFIPWANVKALRQNWVE